MGGAMTIEVVQNVGVCAIDEPETEAVRDFVSTQIRSDGSRKEGACKMG